jgi:hypothetical protein
MNESTLEKDTAQSLRKWGDTDRREDRPNLYFPVYAELDSQKVSLEPFPGSTELYPTRPDGTEGCWRWSKTKILDELHRVLPRRTQAGGLGLYVLSEEGTNKVSPWVSLNEDDDTADLAWHSIISDYAKGGGTHLKNILGEKAFTYPKNPDYIEWICSLVRRTDAVFLDFFAGSGTTGEAVLKLNKKDNGTRTFICASSTEATKDRPLKNICRDVTQLRLRKVIQGYSYNAGKAQKMEPGLGGGFAYFTVHPVEARHLALDLQDEQLWTALQLRVTGEVSPFDAAAPLQIVRTENGVVCYARNAGSPSALALLKELCEAGAPVQVFSWKQPDRLSRLLEVQPNLTCGQIPSELIDMFGGY